MRGRLARALIALASAWLALEAHPIRSDPVEPPPEVTDGDDYEVERVDSLGQGDVEVGLGFVARDGRHASRRRHASFRSDSLDGTVRDGAGDALAGTALEGAAAGGRFGIGRAPPMWGRGLVLGDAREPWAWRERGFRRRASGDVAWYRGGYRALTFGAWGGAIGRRTHAGLETGGAGFGAGIAGDRRGGMRGSAWWARERDLASSAFEIALDRRGRWRGETAASSRRGDAHFDAWVRAGQSGFRPIGDPRRAGPPAALSARAAAPFAPHPAARVSALAALWRFAAGASGARATLEVEHGLAHHAMAVVGFEEQHGTRRDPALAASTAGANGFHQGAWGEWRAATGPVGLGWREERWGERAWARAAMRAVSTARIGIESRAGLALRVTHAVFRVRRGEHLYLPEVEADRLVLRALTGNGERTRIELRLPFARGRVQAALNRTAVPPRAPRLQWTLEWTRHARFGRGS